MSTDVRPWAREQQIEDLPAFLREFQQPRPNGGTDIVPIVEFAFSPPAP